MAFGASLSGKRVLVMGLGRFGGGVGVTRFLVGQGARVLVTDQLPAASLTRSVAELAGLPVDYRLGEHVAADFTAADLIVVNPAVDPRNNTYLQAARAAGVPLTSEIRLLTAHLPSRSQVLGITGSAGKSTTTAMLGHMLAACLGPGRVHVGGNLGGSLLGRLEQIAADHLVVLELSSFMLEGLDEDRWSPHIALITNLAENHLDRHGDFSSYVKAKGAILRHQQADDYAILGPGVLAQLQPVVDAEHLLQIAADADLPARVELLIPGTHNRRNAAMALAAAGLLGVEVSQAAASLADFPGLPHRLQFVCEHQQVRYFNDSKATTPEAAMLALESFPLGRVHAILGGYDKHSDLTALATFAARHCRAVYTIGVTGPAIAAAVQQVRQVPPPAGLHQCTTLDQALAATVGNLHQGDVVLLSPGCASWDQFENYEARGSAFVAAVLRYTGEGVAPTSPA